MSDRGFDVAYQQLLGAVEHLAVSDLPMRTRVTGAARYGRKLRRKHLPQHAWPRLHRLLSRLAHGAGCTGLSPEEADRCAKEFVAIFNMVSSEQTATTDQ